MITYYFRNIGNINWAIGYNWITTLKMAKRAKKRKSLGPKLLKYKLGDLVILERNSRFNITGIVLGIGKAWQQTDYIIGQITNNPDKTTSSFTELINVSGGYETVTLSLFNTFPNFTRISFLNENLFTLASLKERTLSKY